MELGFMWSAAGLSLLSVYTLFSVYGIYTAYRWRNALPLKLFLAGAILILLAYISNPMLSILSALPVMAGVFCLIAVSFMLPTYGVIGLAGRIGTGGVRKTLYFILLMALYFIIILALILFFLMSR